GSGTGGPACDLARQFGCHVLGVDVSAVGHDHAVSRAHELGLEHVVHFRLGDIHSIQLPPAAFDVVMGLDAWCHIPRRADLLRRCATVLRPGGRVAFYDHVERVPMPEDERRRFCRVWRFAGLESPQSYRAALEAAGLRLLHEDETSAYAVRFYSRLLDHYRAERAAFESARGPDRYQEGLERLEMTRRLAVAGVLGQLGCIAEKPADSLPPSNQDRCTSSHRMQRSGWLRESSPGERQTCPRTGLCVTCDLLRGNRGEPDGSTCEAPAEDNQAIGPPSAGEERWREAR